MATRKLRAHTSLLLTLLVGATETVGAIVGTTDTLGVSVGLVVGRFVGGGFNASSRSKLSTNHPLSILASMACSKIATVWGIVELGSSTR